LFPLWVGGEEEEGRCDGEDVEGGTTPRLLRLHAAPLHGHRPLPVSVTCEHTQGPLQGKRPAQQRESGAAGGTCEGGRVYLSALRGCRQVGVLARLQLVLFSLDLFCPSTSGHAQRANTHPQRAAFGGRADPRCRRCPHDGIIFVSVWHGHGRWGQGRGQDAVVRLHDSFCTRGRGQVEAPHARRGRRADWRDVRVLETLLPLSRGPTRRRYPPAAELAPSLLTHVPCRIAAARAELLALHGPSRAPPAGQVPRRRQDPALHQDCGALLQE
jgi:hypothetical protein